MIPGEMGERDWELLLTRIRQGKCTPFIGAGTCYNILPLAAEIAKKWGKKHGYPLKDTCNNLACVAQFLAVEYDNMFPKQEIQEWFRALGSPDFSKPDEPHGVLADLPLPIYITTNYDDFMVRALKSRGKEPVREFCRWDASEEGGESESEYEFDPSPEKPLVYHLHGIIEDEHSMVLTEDDYLDFMVRMLERTGDKRSPIPNRIKAAFRNTSLLFIGYGFGDWDFRVLFRSVKIYVRPSAEMKHVSVQFIGDDADQASETEKARRYLSGYFDKSDIRVYWGDCRKFAAELRKRWGEFSHGH